MAILTSDIAVLIPSYKRKELTLNCLESAIANHPGEILVSEDAGDYSIVESILRLNNPVVKVFYQDKNLGLWKNHLFLLKKTSKPWIKFVQTDDSMLPGTLEKMSRHVDKSTAVVSYLPVYLDFNSNIKYKYQEQSEVLRLSAREFVKRAAIRGNELGRPSNNLYRKACMNLGEEDWLNEMSCDYSANLIVGSKGDVVILPPGDIITGIHSDQDIHKQDFSLAFKRWLNTLNYLNCKGKTDLKKSISIVSLVEFVAQHRNFFGYLKTKRNPFKGFKTADYWQLVTSTSFKSFIFEFRKVLLFYKWKYQQQTKIKVD